MAGAMPQQKMPQRKMPQRKVDEVSGEHIPQPPRTATLVTQNLPSGCLVTVTSMDFPLPW